MSNFINDLPGEISDEMPDCLRCDDAGVDIQREDFCQCAAGLRELNKLHDEPEDPQARVDEREYQAGVARGNLHSAERKLYGSALADQFAMEDEWNDFNNGY